MILIDRKGYARWAATGYSDGEKEILTKWIKLLLKEKA